MSKQTLVPLPPSPQTLTPCQIWSVVVWPGPGWPGSSQDLNLRLDTTACPGVDNWKRRIGWWWVACIWIVPGIGEGRAEVMGLRAKVNPPHPQVPRGPLPNWRADKGDEEGVQDDTGRWALGPLPPRRRRRSRGLGNEHISMDLHMHTQADALYKHCWAHMCHSWTTKALIRTHTWTHRHSLHTEEPV